MKNELVTIAIPAYRRPDALRAVLEKVSDAGITSSEITFLILNDSGRQEDNIAYREVVETFRRQIACPVRYLENSRNEGYPRALLKLLQESDTPYVFLTADDDFLELEHFDEFMEFLGEQQPDICSTQYFSASRLTRGAHQLRPARPKEFGSVNGHAPGVVYRKEALQPYLKQVEEAIERKETVALLYPQALFTMHVLASGGRCWFYPKAFVKEGFKFETGIVDEGGSQYGQFLSRARQIASFETVILTLPKSPQRDEMLLASRINSVRACILADPRVLNEIKNELRVTPKKVVARFMPRRLKDWLKRLLRT